VEPDLDHLPDDPDALRTMLREMATAVGLREVELQALTVENDKLRALVAQLLRHRFGRRSEQLSADERQMALEDLEQAKAEADAAAASAAPPETPRRERKKRPQRNLGALPGHLPRYEVVVDVADKGCPCCGGTLHLIDESRSELLDFVPAQLRVKVTSRPRYGCRACEGAVVQAPAPARPIDGGLASEALLAHVLVSKFCDHLPLYRQAGMLARQGIAIDRSTLSGWVGRACWWLRPLHELMLSTALASPVLFADDTTLPVLDPGRGKTKTGRLWCYAVDPRPWKGTGHPIVAYRYSENRKGEHPAGHLAGFRGKLQVDGYSGFGSLANGRGDAIELVFCWAHCRRYFYEFHTQTQSPLAAEALRRIAQLYAIEAEITGQTAEQRHAVRQSRSRPIVEALHTWLQDTLRCLSTTSKLADAIGYALRHWSGLVRFLDDGRLAIDTNVVERGMRPVALGRKNALFAGSDRGAGHWAIALTLINTAKLNGVEPLAWLTDVLERIVSGDVRSHQLEQLLPWNWRPPNATPLALAA
jgi:transposase